MFIIIMALAVVFGLLLIVTTVLVCIFVRRRKKRMLSDGWFIYSKIYNMLYTILLPIHCYMFQGRSSRLIQKFKNEGLC